MGFSDDRFTQKDIKNDLICAICHCVLQDPVQLSSCEHTFCRECIKKWIATNRTCPTDRAVIDAQNNKIGPPNKLLLTLLNSLTLRCEYTPYGCTTVTSWSTIEEHQRTCIYHPEIEVECSGDCQLKFLRKDQKKHDCALALQTRITMLNEAIEEKDREIESQEKEDKDFMSDLSKLLVDAKIAAFAFNRALTEH